MLYSHRISILNGGYCYRKSYYVTVVPTHILHPPSRQHPCPRRRGRKRRRLSFSEGVGDDELADVRVPVGYESYPGGLRRRILGEAATTRLWCRERQWRGGVAGVARRSSPAPCPWIWVGGVKGWGRVEGGTVTRLAADRWRGWERGRGCRQHATLWLGEGGAEWRAGGGRHSSRWSGCRWPGAAGVGQEGARGEEDGHIGRGLTRSYCYLPFYVSR